jgi:hypothetical protein
MNPITNLSYEARMLRQYKMPIRKEVENALLVFLFNHNGVIKEFSASEEIVDEIANHFSLTKCQRQSYLETLYSKKNRIKKSLLWHRLLFRVADHLARRNWFQDRQIPFFLPKEENGCLPRRGLILQQNF